MVKLQKLFNENKIGIILISFIGLYVLYMFLSYFQSKGSYGDETMNVNINSAYKNSYPQSNVNITGQPQPSEVLSQTDTYASADGIKTNCQGLPISSNTNVIQNPSDLLPKDVNAEWAQFHPTGQGMLSNINLLKAGYHIGIDSVGQTLKNANLQIRSEPPNPQTHVSIWNNSTITPDFLRVPLEINSTTA